MNGSELKKKRIDAGLYQAALEQMSGVGRTYISLYENGRVAISDEHASCFFNILNSDALGKPVLPLDEYRSLRNGLHEKLAYAPPGLLWGIDTEVRNAVLEKVLISIVKMRSMGTGPSARTNPDLVLALGPVPRICPPDLIPAITWILMRGARTLQALSLRIAQR